MYTSESFMNALYGLGWGMSLIFSLPKPVTIFPSLECEEYGETCCATDKTTAKSENDSTRKHLHATIVPPLAQPERDPRRDIGAVFTAAGKRTPHARESTIDA